MRERGVSNLRKRNKAFANSSLRIFPASEGGISRFPPLFPVARRKNTAGLRDYVYLWSYGLRNRGLKSMVCPYWWKPLASR